MHDLERQVLSIIADQLGLDGSDIKLDTPLGSLGDSLDAVEVAMEAEDEFDIRIPEESCESLKTVGDLVALVRRLSDDREGGAGVEVRLKPPQTPPGEARRMLGDE